MQVNRFKFEGDRITVDKLKEAILRLPKNTIEGIVEENLMVVQKIGEDDIQLTFESLGVDRSPYAGRRVKINIPKGSTNVRISKGVDRVYFKYGGVGYGIINCG